MSGRNFSLKEMETTSSVHRAPDVTVPVRKELLSERDGNTTMHFKKDIPYFKVVRKELLSERDGNKPTTISIKLFLLSICQEGTSL